MAGEVGVNVRTHATFEREVKELVADGFVLAGRIGFHDGFELRARADGVVERVDHEAFVQLVVARDVRDVLVRVEAPGEPARLLVLTHDRRVADLCVVSGPLYLGGALRVLERVDDPHEVERRWAASELGSCWVSGRAPHCC